jgi:hypothetical protein
MTTWKNRVMLTIEVNRNSNSVAVVGFKASLKIFGAA